MFYSEYGFLFFTGNCWYFVLLYYFYDKILSTAMQQLAEQITEMEEWYRTLF